MTPARARDRHSRWLYPLSVATAIALLVSWFPLGTLLRQRAALAAVSSQIAAVERQRAALATQRRVNSSTTQVLLRAREQYQLVEPGQSLVQVLPGASGVVSAGSGDPGNQPLVAPALAGVSAADTPRARGASQSPGGWRGFVDRLARTLEFWR